MLELRSTALLGLVLCANLTILPFLTEASPGTNFDGDQLVRDASEIQDSVGDIGDAVGGMQQILDGLNEGMKGVCAAGKFLGPATDGLYVPEANGCGPSGIQVPEDFGLYRCCNRHGACCVFRIVSYRIVSCLGMVALNEHTACSFKISATRFVGRAFRVAKRTSRSV